MAWRLGMRLALVVGALLSLSACATHRVATAPARPAPPPTIPAPPSTPAVGYEETGEASWYGNPYHGRRAASGEIYDMNQMTAAHRTLPFGARIRVQSLVDGSSVEVRVNDRGPFKDSEKRILDLSYAAARLLGAIGPGVIPIRLRVVSMPSPPTATAPPPATAPSATVPSPPPAAPAAPVAAAASPSPPPAAAAASSEPAASPPAQAAPPLAAEKREPRVTMVSSAEAAAQPPSPSLPAATASPPPSASRTVEGWSLQLAAYASEAPALSLRDSLARSWPDARVLRAEVGGRPMWRVRVGNYATRREADEAAKRLAASGHRAMVVEAGPP